MSRLLLQRFRIQHAALLAVCGSIAAFMMVELGVRLALPTSQAGGDSERERYSVPDPLLGRIPRAGMSVHDPERGLTIRIGEHGTRFNGDTPPPSTAGPVILAVGDSFTFGDEVSDDASWPAVLEQLLGKRVINAGIPGFGFDQTVLRAEQLARIYDPEMIVASFIPHDIARCEFSHFAGNAKPYFEVVGTELRLHPPTELPRSPLAFLEGVLASSAAVRKALPELVTSIDYREVIVHRQGREVACRLMERLAALAKTSKRRVVILAQPGQPSATPDDLGIKNEVLSCAAQNQLAILDLFPVIEAQSPEQRATLFDRHMTAAGNRLVATEIVRFLRQSDTSTLPPPSDP